MSMLFGFLIALLVISLGGLIWRLFFVSHTLDKIVINVYTVC